MNEEYETGIGCIAAFLLGIVIALLALCSCGSKNVVTEQEYVHDTLYITHSDTVSIDRWHVRNDTIRIETERVVTLVQPDKTQPAETVRVETNNWHWQKEVLADSTSKVVARVDSVLRAMDASHIKEAEKQKSRMPWWGWLAIGGCLAIGSVGVLISHSTV